MFNFFRKKSIEDELQYQYEQLMAEGHKLLFTNSNQSTVKYNEAQRILNKMESLRNAF